MRKWRGHCVARKITWCFELKLDVDCAVGSLEYPNVESVHNVSEVRSAPMVPLPGLGTSLRGPVGLKLRIVLLPRIYTQNVSVTTATLFTIPRC